jgi:hypothetical protein
LGIWAARFVLSKTTTSITFTKNVSGRARKSAASSYTRPLILFYGNTSEDLFVEVSHGPYLIDHNIFLSEYNYKELSQGGALVHNLFTGKLATLGEMGRFTPYHFPHETAVAGVMTISGGDVRFFNNLFIGDKDVDKEPERRIFWNGGAVVEGTPEAIIYLQKPVGTGGYDDYPSEQNPKPWELPGRVPGFAPRTDELKLPVFIKHNVYLNGAKPCVKEPDAVVHRECGVEVCLDEERGVVRIKIADPAQLACSSSEIITTEKLGVNFHAEMKYEEADGSPYTLDTDFLGTPRATTPSAGPFEANAPLNIELGYKKRGC